ncbi:MAG: ABC transporter substrate-binding protein [Chloroflexi bacterium]|nr:ABC transporter substrate-binding protein [Chloroflexota bacterium]
MGTQQSSRRGAVTRRGFLGRAALALAGAVALPAVVGEHAAHASALTGQQAPALRAAQAANVLQVSQSVDLNTLHPWLGTLNVWKVIKENIYDQLVYQDPQTYEFKAKLGRTFEWVDGNTALQITLPPGVTFHSGDPLTADDVKFTIESIIDPTLGSWLRGNLVQAGVTGVTVVDATTLKINTGGFHNLLIPALTYVDIAPRSMGTDLAKTNPVGSGPFKFVDWVPNDRITLARNDSYWDQSRFPTLDGIVFKPVTELQTRLSQLLAGNVDLVYDFSLQEAPRMQADSRVVVTVVPPADQMFVAYLNMRKPPFDNVYARQAIGWALDRQGFIDGFLSGLGRVSMSPFTPAHWAYDPAIEGTYGYNPDTVAQLLEKAGYAGGKGFDFTMLVPNGYPEFKQISTLIQATFASLGTQPRIEEVEIAQWASRINQSREFDMAVDYPPRGTADPSLTYGAGNLFPPTAFNATGLTDQTIPGYVDNLRAGATSNDLNTRKGIYSQVQQLWNQYLPGPVFAHRATVHASTPGVGGFIPHPAFQQDFAGVTLKR